MWYEIIYPFRIFNGVTFVVWELLEVIYFYTLLDMWLLIHAWIIVNPY